jgi:hypothetical protein
MLVYAFTLNDPGEHEGESRIIYAHNNICALLQVASSDRINTLVINTLSCICLRGFRSNVF